MEHKTQPETVIAGLTRNLLSKKGTPSCSGDGGFPLSRKEAAMTVKGAG